MAVGGMLLWEPTVGPAEGSAGTKTRASCWRAGPSGLRGQTGCTCFALGERRDDLTGLLATALAGRATLSDGVKRVNEACFFFK